MGYIKHDMIVIEATNLNCDNCDKKWNTFKKRCKKEFPKGMPGGAAFSDTCVNGTVFAVMFPDGSKEGWEDSNKGDDYRKKFVELAKNTLSWGEIIYISWDETGRINANKEFFDKEDTNGKLE